MGAAGDTVPGAIRHNSPNLGVEHGTGATAGGATSGSQFAGKKTREFPSNARVFAGYVHQLKTVRRSPPQDRRYNCSNWVVTTTIAPPTKALKALVSLNRSSATWCSVVVGDKAGPKTWGLSTSIFLSWKDQIAFAQSNGYDLGWNCFVHKSFLRTQI